MEDGSSLAGTIAWLMPDSTGAVADAYGYVEFKDIAAGNKFIRFSLMGYDDRTIEFYYDGSRYKAGVIKLHYCPEVLDVVTIMDEHAKQERSLASEYLTDQFFEQRQQGSFAAALEKLPGISALNTGVGIAKPVIRGLSSNRIIVNHYGIKQEGHQWGADHGLEIDAFDIERVEIIKGPASLQYGSDGLGGVINILSGNILTEDRILASLSSVYKSNNKHIGNSGKVALRKANFLFSARYSLQEYSDYRVPANSFDYNGFTLPIFNNSLKNTAGRESNYSIMTGYIFKNAITRVIFNHYQLNAGIFSGAVGIPRSYTLADDGNSRNIETPSQSVDHYRVTLNQSVAFGRDHLLINAGFQHNQRREFSFPEFHNIPRIDLDPEDRMAIGLDLRSYSANAHYEKHLHGARLVLGANGQYQENIRSGFEFLLPDFTTWRSGAFIFYEKHQSDRTVINAGLRADYGTNKTEFNRQFIWNAAGMITDSLIVPQTDDVFFNWSGSFGMNYHLGERTNLLINLGKSFRIPYPSETVSNGIHHGSFRHEVGTPDLKSESGYQLDAGIEFERTNLLFSFQSYFNYFQNYIYLGPQFPARFSPLPEAGQIFQYRQDNAIYTGFELFALWKIHRNIHWSPSADFVQSYNTTTGLALPFTPQPTLKSELSYLQDKLLFANDFSLNIEVMHYFAANGSLRIDRSERPTPAATLLNASIHFGVKSGTQNIRISLIAQNLSNAFFLNHLSRYRLINVPEQGRNFIVSVKVPFGISL
jgi:iron complex outermembrane recepter protein